MIRKLYDTKTGRTVLITDQPDIKIHNKWFIKTTQHYVYTKTEAFQINHRINPAYTHIELAKVFLTPNISFDTSRAVNFYIILNDILKELQLTIDCPKLFWYVL